MTTTERIAELQEYARQDGERYNENSIADFLAFPQRINGMEGPFIFMEDEGNIRAVWRNTYKRFGIEFFGEGKGRLVLSSTLEDKPEIVYFTLTGIPTRLSTKSVLSFAREHVYEDPEEISFQPDRHVLSTS